MSHQFSVFLHCRLLHFTMPLLTDRLFLQPSLRCLGVLVYFLFLTHICKVFLSAASELICSHEPIVALVGEDVLLPCHLEPAVSVSDETVVWTRPDLIPKYIHYHQDGRLLFEKQNPSYSLRTRLFMDELLRGNVSMKIFRVKISDAGRYHCVLEPMVKEDFIQLIVGAVSTPFIEVVTNNSEHVVLQCNSTGWYPEPEVFWLDGEGNLLSAGPTETVRGPDDLYTVSSRVTVEKRHSNSFTCRVQQNHINQTREAHIHVPVSTDFSTVQFFSPWLWIGVVSLDVVWIFIIIIIVMTGFFTRLTDTMNLWRRRRRNGKHTSVKAGHQMVNLKHLIEKGRESPIVTGQQKKLKKTMRVKNRTINHE
ncbi:butyrophilin-like protein 10 [Acanthopagrus latus]|uniref:butyrophilin-like protein 10 n=1 Tax=Acanthopagrus latus TaxID=8177 RepID=UPI00187C910D|nr:butyrophilin-like protein 10 [Acanthopagrus latus]